MLNKSIHFLVPKNKILTGRKLYTVGVTKSRSKNKVLKLTQQLLRQVKDPARSLGIDLRCS